IEPTTLVGLERFLGSGTIHGVGPALAKRIVEKFQLDTLKILDDAPERLSEVPGLGPKRIQEIKESWAAQRALSSVLVLLQTHGASPGLAQRIVKHYGDRAASILQRSPYRMALDVRGVGFKTADRIAASLGIARDHPERCQAGILHVLGELSESGHVYAPKPDLFAAVAELLGVGVDHVEAGLDALRASERVVVTGEAVYLARLERAEAAVARGVRRLLEGRGRVVAGVDRILDAFETKRGIQLAPAQRLAVETAA